MYRTHWATLVISLLLVLGAGCNDDPCPPGQVEYNGECVDVVGDASAICGTGTYYNGVEDACFPDPNVVCGPATEVEWVLDEDGLPTEEFICKGTGGGNIPIPPECPDAQPGGKICVNGWIKYLIDPDDTSKLMETLAQFDSATLTVKVYDPLAYAVNPSVAPLSVAEVVPEDGTFKAEGITVPSTGYLAVVVDDDENAGADNYVFTGFAYEGAAGVNMEGIDGYVVTSDQNTTWSEDSGFNAAFTDSDCKPGGAGDTGTADSLFTCGTWVGVYGYRDASENLVFIEGAQPQKLPGPTIVDASKTFYLNPDHETFTPGTTSNQTNETGIVFYPSARLGSYAGVCAADTPCDDEGYTWNQTSGRTGGSAPNAIFVQLMYPEGLE